MAASSLIGSGLRFFQIPRAFSQTESRSCALRRGYGRSSTRVLCPARTITRWPAADLLLVAALMCPRVTRDRNEFKCILLQSECTIRFPARKYFHNDILRYESPQTRSRTTECPCEVYPAHLKNGAGSRDIRREWSGTIFKSAG